MINLNNFLFKKVIIIDDEDNVWHGRVSVYESAYDNDSEEDSIIAEIVEKNEMSIEFTQSEIKSIEIDNE